MKKPKLCLALLLSAGIAAAVPAKGAELFFREGWREIPAATPVTQEHVDHDALEVERHGPGRDGIRKSHHENIPDDPFYIWSGRCEGNWAVSLRHSGARVDLTAPGAKIRWRAKQSGFRALRVIVQLENGDWLVADQADGESSDWRVREFIVADLGWRAFNIETVAEGNRVDSPDLSSVERIGFTDLMAGGHTAASSRLDWIEVYGRGVERVSER